MHVLNKLVIIGMVFRSLILGKYRQLTSKFLGSKTAPNSLMTAIPLGNIDIILDTEIKLNPCDCTVGWKLVTGRIWISCGFMGTTHP